MDACLKQLMVISRREDGVWKRVPVSGGHLDKRVGENAGSIFIQFDSEGVLMLSFIFTFTFHFSFASRVMPKYLALLAYGIHL